MIDPLLTWILASCVEEKGGLGGRGESPPFMADLRGPISNQTKRFEIKHIRWINYRLKPIASQKALACQNLSANKINQLSKCQ